MKLAAGAVDDADALLHDAVSSGLMSLRVGLGVMCRRAGFCSRMIWRSRR